MRLIRDAVREPVLALIADRPPERGPVAPPIRLIEWMLVVGDVDGVDLGRAVSRQQGGERLVHERRVYPS